MTTTRQLVLPGEIVKKSNALLRAHWSPESIWEPRLVAHLASKVRMTDDDFQIYEIRVSELLGAKYGGSDLKALEAAVDRAMGRVLTIREGKGWVKYTVFHRCRFRPEDSVLELGFHPDLRPHYLGLQERFAKYNLLEFMLLPSVYSQRLFEVLKSWSDKPEVTIALLDLFPMLDVPPTLQRYPDFRRYVLDRAHRDITAHTSLRYDWEPLKQGRAVASIRFAFGPRSALVTKAKKQASSLQNNLLLKKAISCFQSSGGNCIPNSGRKCDLCKRLVNNK